MILMTLPFRDTGSANIRNDVASTTNYQTAENKYKQSTVTMDSWKSQQLVMLILGK